MASGGHARSGPPPNPKSGRSDRRGITVTALPSEGFKGEAPDLTKYLPEASDRHEAIWAEVWTTPQACAWMLEPWRWPLVADFVKWSARSESSDAPAAVGALVRQLRDDCGLSKAGMAREGWAIAPDELGAKAASKEPVEPTVKQPRRLRAADA
jgi:hypothetical protein